MDTIKIKEIAFKLMANRKAHLEREKGAIYYHGERVAKTIISLREIILPNDDSNDEILTIAAWFHDIAKGIEPHAKYGAPLAKEALKELIPPAELDTICDLIALHCDRHPESNEHSTLAKLLQDADLIDHFGVYEIWMNFQYYAYTNEPMSASIDFFEKEYPLLSEKCRELLNFEVSRRVFDEKYEFAKLFIERMKIEGIGDIYNLDKLI